MAMATDPNEEVPALVPATPADWPLIRRWIARPEMQRWWGSPASAEAEIRIAQQSRQALSRLIAVSGTPVGYAHAIDASYWGADLPADMPAGAWEVDLFIGEPAFRGRGLAEQALAALCAEVFSTTLAVALAAIVPVRREAAVRVFERAGFVWRAVWNDPVDGPSWLMLRERA